MPKSITDSGIFHLGSMIFLSDLLFYNGTPLECKSTERYKSSIDVVRLKYFESHYNL